MRQVWDGPVCENLLWLPPRFRLGGGMAKTGPISVQLAPRNVLTDRRKPNDCNGCRSRDTLALVGLGSVGLGSELGPNSSQTNTLPHTR